MQLALKIAWEQPDLEADQGTTPQEPNSDALNHWQSAVEFTLTLQSGQTVEVKFVPCLVGDRRMHEFSFTGPVSTTGFKSHFVLAIEAEEFPQPRDYAQAYAQELVDQHESKTETPSKKRSHSTEAVPAPHSPMVDHDDSTPDPAMTEDKTTELKHTPVEVVEELSVEEAADRQRLELLVERAFYQAGSGLRELQSRRLYRSTHKTFEEYCQDRFGFTRYTAYYKIAASEVFDNLLTKSQQNSPTKNHQILPTKETQVRPLAKLDPEEQCLVWQQAVETAGGKVPSERIVKDAVLRHKGVVDSPKQQHPSPREFAPGDVVEIKALKLEPLHPFNGMWAIVEHVGSFSYTVRISITRDKQQCKKEELTLIDDEYTADIKAVAQRIAALIQFELEPFDYAILELLQLETCFTPRQLLYLERMEADYGKSN